MPGRRRPRSPHGKLLAAVLVLALVAVGMIGIVLPIIPGLALLALAGLVVARHVPSIDARLRNHRSFGRHMHSVDRFFDLGLRDQLCVAGLVTLKGTLDLLDRASARLWKHGPDSRARPS